MAVDFLCYMSSNKTVFGLMEPSRYRLVFRDTVSEKHLTKVPLGEGHHGSIMLWYVYVFCEKGIAGLVSPSH